MYCNSNCPFDPNLCVFPDHFCSSWQKCENCSCKFLEKDNKIEQIAPSGWEANECAKSSAGRFEDLSTQLVATQELKQVENDIHF